MPAEQFDIGTPVVHAGRRYVMRGYSRLSLDSTQYVDLEDAVTGERVTIQADQVSLPGPSGEVRPDSVVPLRPDLEI
jgi:hypothetical protein